MDAGRVGSPDSLLFNTYEHMMQLTMSKLVSQQAPVMLYFETSSPSE